jgi:hypothetical protein
MKNFSELIRDKIKGVALLMQHKALNLKFKQWSL